MAIAPFAPSPEESKAVAAAVAIPAHVVQGKGHGHAGTAMALAPLAHTLFQRVLRHDPATPQWEGRDRLILSAGHASLLLYAQLHLTGYDLELDELPKSRSLGSRTPGHPELHHTAGVEMSTGPLGQGVASAVGLALAARRDDALHSAGTGLFDPTVWVIAGDGCLQEGVSAEASSLAGTQGLDNLVVVWDDNGITIDGATSVAFAEDVRARYRAYGWRVLEAGDFRDVEALEQVLLEAKTRTGAPTLVALKTTIGWPSSARQGTPAAHAGGFGADDVAAIKAELGFAPDATLEQLVPGDVLEVTRAAVARGRELRAEWDAAEARWRQQNPGLARRRDALGAIDPLVLHSIELPAVGTAVATRKTNGAVLKAVAGTGGLFGGSADLSDSTNVAVPGAAVSAANPGGDFVPFGIREHAMAAVLSGIALHGLWRPYGSTYLVFSDYLRPSLRLAALMDLPALYVFTHDSIAVGEDGPTHQPVEQIASLRTVPGLSVVRPADAAEVVAVWRRLLARPQGPAALVLSRQDLPALSAAAPEGAESGGYVLWQHGEGDELALIATGSEVSLALQAARTLAEDGVAVRVVSMPCVEWFEQADAAHRDAVLPPALRARVAVEAGRGAAWHRWTGLDGRVVSVEDFGESGAGAELLRLRGITVEAVLEAARSVLEPAGVTA